MTHTEITAFLAICRYKNISKAAEELYTSQATLSAHLKALEKELGYTLLFRQKGKRSLTLTTQGENFYQLALQYQDITQKILSSAKTLMHEKLQITTINSVGNDLLPPVLKLFMERHPRYKMTVKSMSAESAALQILHGQSDLALSTAKMETDQIVATLCLHDPFVVICPADSTYPETVTIKDLPPWDEIFVRWSSEYDFWHESTFGESLHQFELSLMEQIPLFVSQPNKWAIVPKSMADHICINPDFRQCTPAFRIPKRSIYILRHRDNAETTAIHYFFDALREVLQKPYGDNFLL